jgi:drug/metabolite transporter (DMT)-like permease
MAKRTAADDQLTLLGHHGADSPSYDGSPPPAEPFSPAFSPAFSAAFSAAPSVAAPSAAEMRAAEMRTPPTLLPLAPPPLLAASAGSAGSAGRRGDSAAPRYYRLLGVRCSRSQWLGVACLVVCLISWETMGELLQDVNLGYPKPGFLTYLVHTCYGAALVPWCIYRRGEIKARLRANTAIFTLALKMFPLMWCAAYFWYVSLPRTLVSANNAIYQSQCVFVYIFSILLLGDKLRLAKSVALGLCVTGVLFVVFSVPPSDAGGGASPSPSPAAPTSASPSSAAAAPVIHQTVGGYLALIVSVMTFALYEVLFKRAEMLREEDAGVGDASNDNYHHDSNNNHHPNMGGAGLEESLLFLGFSGVINFIIAWPILLILGVTGVEVYEPMGEFGGQIMLNGFIDTVFNGAFIWGVSLTSPVFMSTGTIIIIPLGIVVDIVLGKGSMSFVALCGVCLIVAGFLALNVISSRQQKALDGKTTSSARHGTSDAII